MQALVEEIKKTVVFLGRRTEEEKIQFHATGFLVNIQKVFHLATAKHVVVSPDFIDSEMLVCFNLKDGGIGCRTIDEIKNKYEVDWVFHENEAVDIAMIPFGLDTEKDDVKTIPDNLFIGLEGLFELDDVFFLSYQPGINLQQRVSPVIRSGTISLVNDDRTFYIDGFSFPGNSGSPVFLKPSPIRFGEEGISIGKDQPDIKFIGIIGEYLTYRETAISTQTGRPRVVFEENTGLSRVWSVTFINDIVESDTFKQQLDKLTKK